MRISSSVEYGMRVMVTLARQPEGGRLSAESLSESENIPKDYVDQILQRLRRSGLVLSVRGAAGGYTLAKEPTAIRVGDVVRALETRIFEEPCERYSGGEKDCHHQTGCGIRPVWEKLGRLVEEYFDGVTLDRLLEETPASFVKISGGGPKSWR